MPHSRHDLPRPRRRALVAASGMAIALLLAGCRVSTDPAEPEDPDLALLEALPYATWETTEEPEKRGIVHWDEERSWGGINLYTNDADEAYLMDMAGRRLHTWTLPEDVEHCEYFVLLEHGQIVAECQGQGLLRLDVDSRVVWRLPANVHHDIHVEPEGSLVTFVVSHHLYRGRRVNFDALLRVTPDGRARGKWLLYRHFEALRPLHPPSPLDDPTTEFEEQAYDYYHANAVSRLPATSLGRADDRFREGNFLLSLRNVSTLVILDQESMEPVWSWGPGEIEYQHTPSMLPNGNLLIFDNGLFRGVSRVIELDPRTETIVWRYEPADPEVLFTRFQGAAQRLPNGNTVITESRRGRVLEITPDGDIVWEFWNPDLAEGERRRIYRLERMSSEEVASRMRLPAEAG